jgi:hypothetical protein
LRSEEKKKSEKAEHGSFALEVNRYVKPGQPKVVLPPKLSEPGHRINALPASSCPRPFPRGWGF